MTSTRYIDARRRTGGTQDRVVPKPGWDPFPWKIARTGGKEVASGGYRCRTLLTAARGLTITQ